MSPISDQTVCNILRRDAIAHAPARKHTTTWANFIGTHLALIGQGRVFVNIIPFGELSVRRATKELYCALTERNHWGQNNLLNLRGSQPKVLEPLAGRQPVVARALM